MKPLLILGLSTFLLSGALQAESLADFLKKVRSKNLEITSQNSLISAAEARSKGFSIKAPMIGFSQMRNLEGKAYAYEVQQEVPLSNRLATDKRMREQSFELQKKESEYFSTEKLLEARVSFVKYWKTYEKSKYLTEIREWLDTHLKYARSVVRTDASSNIYALEIESYIGILENELSSVKSDIEAQKAKLKELSFDENYDPGVPVVDEPKALATSGENSRMSAINLSRLKVAEAALDTARTSYLPNLTLRGRKLDRQMMGMANQEIMVGIDLPFAFFWQPRAEVAEATAQKMVAEANHRKAEVESEALKRSLEARATILKQQLKTLAEVSIPAARKALRYLKNVSFRDMAALETNRRIFQDYITLRTQQVELRMAYEEIYANWSLAFANGANNEN